MLLGLGSVFAAATPIVSAQTSTPNLESDRTASAEKSSTDELIRELINKLGSDSYATRIRARDRLRLFGLEAFDALREAQYHEDIEILAAARYLIGSLQVSWSKESDPKEVRSILLEYGAQSESDRLGRIEMLGQLPLRVSVEALARIVRFERLGSLSRRAAMLILAQPIGTGPMANNSTTQNRIANQIIEVIGENDRDSSTWLLAYASDLRDGAYDAARWTKIVAEHRRMLDLGIDQELTGDSVVQLARVLATRAIEEGSREAADALVTKHLDLVAPDLRALTEQTEWSLTQGLYRAVVSLQKLHQHAFSQNAGLLYSVAEAYSRLDESATMKQYAEKAFNTDAFPERIAATEEDAEAGKEWSLPEGVTDFKLQEISIAKQMIARKLQDRGQFDWAEREYRRIQEYQDIESRIGLISRLTLALMLSEQLRHRDTIDTLAPIVERAEKDRLYDTRMRRWQINVRSYRCIYYYETALEMLEQDPVGDDFEEVKRLMQMAYNLDPDNIDVLIRMFRLDDPNDPDWKVTVEKQLRQNLEKLNRQIVGLQSRRGVTTNSSLRSELGKLYNQYAWLVSNTEGDFDRALQFSQDSIEFATSDADRSARLDTCARCFFSLKQYDKAIETQRKALKLEPHAPTMNRQLAEFEAARSKAMVEAATKKGS